MIPDNKRTEQQLAKSNDKIQIIINNILDIIVEIDLNGNFIYVSPQIVQMFGYEPNEVIGKKALRFIHPDNLKTVMDAIRDAIINNEHVTFEYRAKHKNGNYVSVSARGGVIKTIDGKKTLLAVIRDITEKKIAEKKLKESERHYRAIIESIGDPIHVIDSNFQIIIINPTLKEWTEPFGINSEFIDKNLFEVFPFLPNNIAEEYKTVFKLGQTLITEECTYVDGKSIYTETRKIPIFEEGKVVQVITILRDITEKKKAEQKIKESEIKYRHLFEASPYFIGLLDAEGILIDCNDTIKEFQSIHTKDDVIGKTFREIFLLNEKNKNLTLMFEKVFKSILNGDNPRPLNFQFYRSKGESMWLHIEGSLIEIGNQKLIQFLIQDITALKKAEKLIIEENEKLLELSKMKSELISRVSHELKTPLNSIYGAVQLILELYKEGLNPDALKFIEMISNGSKRLKLLIENLLDASRIESGKLNLNLQNEDLVEIIKDCIKRIQYLANKRDSLLEFKLPEKVIIKIDKIRIEQVITNLLSNAIKNTPSKGTISVNLGDLGDNICLSIKDTGIGFTENDMEKLFKKFGKIEHYGQQMDIDIEGSGLGLYFSKEIVDLHGGHIWVESAGRNEGSTFYIKLFKNMNDLPT